MGLIEIIDDVENYDISREPPNKKRAIKSAPGKAPVELKSARNRVHASKEPRQIRVKHNKKSAQRASNPDQRYPKDEQLPLERPEPATEKPKKPVTITNGKIKIRWTPSRDPAREYHPAPQSQITN